MINIQGEKIIDLSHSVEPGIPVMPGFPDPKVDWLFRRENGSVFNAEVLTICPHTSTHIDAPWHFFEEGKKIDEIPVDSIIGPAIIVDFQNKEGDVPISAAEIKKWEIDNDEYIKEGDAVLITTGHDKKWGLGSEGENFWKNGWPYITEDAAEYLAEKKIRLIGMEPMAIDGINAKDEAHLVLLPKGIFIIENLTNLDKIGQKRCDLIATVLKVTGGTGCPVRVLAVI